MFIDLTDCFGYENWIDLIGIALTMSCSKYQCSIPKKSCICALISRTPLSDIGMDDLRVKSSHFGVHCIDIHRTSAFLGSLSYITSEVLTSNFKVPS